jgi:hypothetical protein
MSVDVPACYGAAQQLLRNVSGSQEFRAHRNYKTTATYQIMVVRSSAAYEK